MNFIERIVARIFTHIFDKVWDLVKAKVDQQIERDKIYLKHDNLKNEMILELQQANTPEERDAILEKIYNSRPTFE
jgi:hypothetical protein